ncbi:MAG TPA: hypothetical protein VF469_15555 [Kofleriaceae bacterium]
MLLLRGSRWQSLARSGAAALVALVLGACAGGGGTGGAATPSRTGAGAPPSSGANTARTASPDTGGATVAAAASAPAGEPRDPLAGEVEKLVRAAPDRRLERRMLVVELVADWRREAGNDKDSADVIALLRKELSDKLADARAQGLEAGLEILRAEVYDRRARALSRRSFALGKAVIDGAIAEADARARGQQILDEVKTLQAQIRALKDPDRVRVLTNDLQEVSLEATFAITRGATSRRLSDYQSSNSGAPNTR